MIPKTIEKNYSKPNPLETPTLRIIQPLPMEEFEPLICKAVFAYPKDQRLDAPMEGEMNLIFRGFLFLGPQKASFWRGFGILRAPVIPPKTFTTHITTFWKLPLSQKSPVSQASPEGMRVLGGWAR